MKSYMQIAHVLGTLVLSSFLGACSASSTEGNPRPAGNSNGSTGGGSVAPPGQTSLPTASNPPPVLEIGEGVMRGEGNCNPQLIGTVRDFNSRDSEVDPHPDFQSYTGNGITYGLVQRMLGTDGAPAYSNPQPEGNVMITSADSFAKWYSKSHPPERTFDLNLDNPPPSAGMTVTKLANGSTVYESTSFFPIDDKPRIDSGVFTDGDDVPHNFHFTFEVLTTFKYEPNQVFEFFGDDDVWVFVNKYLVVDVGGLHPREEGSVKLSDIGNPNYMKPLNDEGEVIVAAPDLASMPPLVPGEEYELAIFHAERHTGTSNFKATTNIKFTNCTKIVR